MNDDLYLQLGRAIAKRCPAGFREAKLDAMIDGASAVLKIGSVLADGGEFEMTLEPRQEMDLMSAVEAVRHAMAEEDEGNRLWRSCTVTLVAGGGFKMDVEYAPERKDGMQILTQ